MLFMAVGNNRLAGGVLIAQDPWRWVYVSVAECVHSATVRERKCFCHDPVSIMGPSS
jgi:hypothetical protein